MDDGFVADGELVIAGSDAAVALEAVDPALAPSPWAWATTMPARALQSDAAVTGLSSSGNPGGTAGAWYRSSGPSAGHSHCGTQPYRAGMITVTWMFYPVPSHTCRKFPALPDGRVQFQRLDLHVRVQPPDARPGGASAAERLAFRGSSLVRPSLACGNMDVQRSVN